MSHADAASHPLTIVPSGVAVGIGAESSSAARRVRAGRQALGGRAAARCHRHAPHAQPTANRAPTTTPPAALGLRAARSQSRIRRRCAAPSVPIVLVRRCEPVRLDEQREHEQREHGQQNECATHRRLAVLISTVSRHDGGTRYPATQTSADTTDGLDLHRQIDARPRAQRPRRQHDGAADGAATFTLRAGRFDAIRARTRLRRRPSHPDDEPRQSEDHDESHRQSDRQQGIQCRYDHVVPPRLRCASAALAFAPLVERHTFDAASRLVTRPSRFTSSPALTAYARLVSASLSKSA